MDKGEFESLLTYLEKVPSIILPIMNGVSENGLWWMKFQIDIENDYSWNVVQELGCVINYLSLNDRLPTIFYPVSPAPYMNGGPREFLSWVIETTDKNFRPDDLREWLEGRLPNPVNDLKEWSLEE